MSCTHLVMKALAVAASGLHWSGIMVMLYEVMLWLLLWLLGQPGERLCYGCQASHERINMSAVSTAPQVFSSLLAQALPTLHSVNSAHSEKQQDNLHHKHDQ